MRLFELTERSQAERKRQAGVEHDQFFTRPQLASEWAAWVKSQPFYHEVNRVIDPAAGARALSRHFPGAEEYDLHPQENSISRQDFLLSNHRHEPGTLVIMNPPFGTGSDLAIAFFNKAASFADYIAGIFPRSFRRGSLQSRLADDWGLVDEWVLPSYSFFLPAEGREIPYDVPAVAQIWARGAEERAAPPPSRTTSDRFSFTVPAKADFAFRRKGRRAGEVIDTDIVTTNPNSFYYVAGDDRVRAAFERVDWSVYGNDAIGARYITKAEIVAAVEAML